MAKLQLALRMKFSLEAEASDLKSSGVHLEQWVTFPFEPPHFQYVLV